MIIGNFTYDLEDDSFRGTIATLTVERAIHIRPTERRGREPDYRIVSDTSAGPVELGAGWRRKSERGQEFVSLSLDDPAMPASLSAALFFNAEDSSATLVWNRPRPRPTLAADKKAD